MHLDSQIHSKSMNPSKSNCEICILRQSSPATTSDIIRGPRGSQTAQLLFDTMSNNIASFEQYSVRRFHAMDLLVSSPRLPSEFQQHCANFELGSYQCYGSQRETAVPGYPVRKGQEGLLPLWLQRRSSVQPLVAHATHKSFDMFQIFIQIMTTQKEIKRR